MSKELANDLVIICGVFIHPAAKDEVFKYNYEAMKLAIKRTMSGEPKMGKISAKRSSAVHPFHKP
jgi:formaldehyde-activating enzyme